MKKIMMTSLSVCSLGVSCNEMSDTPMLLVVFFRTHHHVTFLDNAVAILNRGNALTIHY